MNGLQPYIRQLERKMCEPISIAFALVKRGVFPELTQEVVDMVATHMERPDISALLQIGKRASSS